MKSNQIEAIAFLLWVLPHAALSQATLPLSTGNLRRTAPKQKGRGAKTPAAVDHPPASADVKVVEYIPPISDNSEEDEDDPYVHVTIGFSDLEATSEIPSFVLPTLPIEEQTHLIANQVLAVANDADVEIVVPEIKTVTVKCHRSEVETIKKKHNVKYVELDEAIHEDDIYPSGETIPEGLSQINGDTHSGFPYLFEGSAACSDPDATRVAVCDGGIDVGHWDFEEWCGINPLNGQPLPGREVRCMGKEFLPTVDAQNGEDWYNSNRNHGVHVAGSIAASGINGKGVTGAIPDQGICLMVIRVFADDGGASLAKLVEGIIYAANEGAKVINMSLGTKSNKSSLRDAIAYAHSKGAILVGSAGNKNENAPNYPAAYPEVVGVAAVDSNKNRAWFSNFGSFVSVSAPGVSQLSTSPRWGSTPYTVIEDVGSGGAVYFEGDLMTYSSYIGIDGVQGTLLNCGSGSDPSPCPPSDGGHICIMSKSGSSYNTKAANCANSGGVAAIIFNDSEDLLRGSMGVDGNSVPKYSNIPVIGVKNSLGWVLLTFTHGSNDFKISNPLEKGTVLTDGYERKTGTSMAAPLVAGILGMMRRQCPTCSSQEVVDCMLNTADPVGSSDLYGRGIVQGDKAFHCIVEKPNAIQLSISSPVQTVTTPPSASPTRGPSRQPTGSPTISPTISPSRPPTESPTLFPSKSPSSSPSRGPSRFPTVSPTASPVISAATCKEVCTNQHAFCLYRIGQVCNADACAGICQAAVSSGTVPATSLEQCRQEWCPNEVPCSASGESSCNNEKTSCELAC